MKILPYDYAVRNLGRSPFRLGITVAGCTLVVLIAIAAAAFIQGMRRSLSVGTGNRNIMLIGAGSEESLERSQIGMAVPKHAQAAIRGIRERLGEPFISPEVHMALLASRPGQDEELRALLRGITPGAFLVHERIQITEGRLPRPGHNELIAGALTADKLGIPESDLAIGKALVFEEQEWTIVGRFIAPGAVMNAELWTAITDLQVATQRNTLSAVFMTLDEDDIADVRAWTNVRLDLELAALSEAEYYSSLQRFYRPVQIMIWVTSFLISLAGILGGLNTLYAAFAARTRELGMLQSLGFSRSAITLSLVQESLLAAGSGALIGCLLGRLLIHGHAVRFSMGVFELQVDAVCILVGVATGVLLGVIGAIPPALRCMRLSIAESLRAT